MAQFIGFAFPFQKSSSSLPATATDDALIKQALVQLILTGRGERVMRPDFGGGAHKYVFEENNLILKHLVEADLLGLIGKYEPRVAVLGIEVERGDQALGATQSENEQSSVIITINYIVLATRTPSSVTITLSPGSTG